MNKHFRDIFISCTAIVILLSCSSIPVFAWGDNSGLEDGRPSFTKEEASGLEFITFNSISDSVIGDEKNFVGARINDGTAVGADNLWYADTIPAEDGKEYFIRLYVHNDNSGGFEAMAEDTTVTFTVPDTSAEEIKVTGWIDVTNAIPTEYWDSVVFASGGIPFHLEYIFGSAYLENNGVGANGLRLSDDIITAKGVKIGYNELDGWIPGGFKYASYICIRVKVVYDYEFESETRIRLVGDSEWHDKIDAKQGDEVELAISYKNLSNYDQNNVVIRGKLPDDLAYIPGTAYLYNANHPDGKLDDDNTICESGFRIGDYAAGTNGYVIFRAKVADKYLQPGKNVLVNWAQVGVGTTTQQKFTELIVEKWDPIGTLIIVLNILIVICCAVLIFSVLRAIKQSRER